MNKVGKPWKTLKNSEKRWQGHQNEGQFETRKLIRSQIAFTFIVPDNQNYLNFCIPNKQKR